MYVCVLYIYIFVVLHLIYVDLNTKILYESYNLFIENKKYQNYWHPW